MVSYQTSAQKTNSIRFGSAKIEVGETEATLVNLGLATSVEFIENYEPITLKPDNGPEIVVGIKEHTATVKFEMWELDLGNLALIRGGIDSYDTEEGNPSTAIAEEHVLTGVEGVRLNFKNGDGTLVNITGATDAESIPTPAVQNTDYIAYLDSAGYTCIARVSASTVLTDGDTIKVTYGYTPAESIKLSTGGLNTVNPRVVRLTNTNSLDKKFQITVYAAKNQGGIELQLPADDADEPLKPTIELRGIVDPTRAAGDQLFEILDEQGV